MPYKDLEEELFIKKKEVKEQQKKSTGTYIMGTEFNPLFHNNELESTHDRSYENDTQSQ